jgi:ribosome biogenesis GTPase
LQGIVIKSTGKWYLVATEEHGILECRVRGKIRLNGLRTTNPISVGDYVVVNDELDKEGKGMITSVNERKNYIVRKSTNLSKESQILAANVDMAYLMVTLKSPVTHLAFIDRFLVSAESFRIPVTILFNKIDTYNEDELFYADALMDMYKTIGYKCHKISAENNQNIDFLRSEITGKHVMISGHSGVGKSTLINKLDSDLQLRTGEISEYHQQGQHTTTFAEMHELKTGGFIIDTPGIRAFGIVGLDKEVMSHYFPEMRNLLGECKYHNCQHLNEPHCAIKDAVEEHIISPSRYQTYVQLMTEDESEIHRKKEF